MQDNGFWLGFHDHFQNYIQIFTILKFFKHCEGRWGVLIQIICVVQSICKGAIKDSISSWKSSWIFSWTYIYLQDIRSINNLHDVTILTCSDTIISGVTYSLNGNKIKCASLIGFELSGIINYYAASLRWDMHYCIIDRIKL